MPSQTCPACNKLQDYLPDIHMALRPPEPGDFGLCHNCGALLRFKDDLYCRVATEQDKEDLKTIESPGGVEYIMEWVRLVRMKVAARNN